MATGVEELLDMLYEMIDEAKGVPLTVDKCMVERDKALDILDDVRAQFPVEFAEARKLLSTRNDYLAAAKREAELIRKQAEEQAKQMVGENQLMTLAKQQSGELMRQSEQKATDVTRQGLHNGGGDQRHHKRNSQGTGHQPQHFQTDIHASLDLTWL